MQPFRFNLEHVLSWNRKLVEVEESRFQSLYASLRQVQVGIAELKAERLAVEQGVVRKANPSAQDLAALGPYRIRVTARDRDLGIEQRRRQQLLDEQRDKLVALQRRVKLLEKLRDRRLEEYTYSMDKELEAIAAEAYMARLIGESHA
ncbi:MAG: hypothetical protein JST11_29715 [Acidobacteria bacterium]|nr:hypothetical protein [Acidobacteriota bacterium]